MSLRDPYSPLLDPGRKFDDEDEDSDSDDEEDNDWAERQEEDDGGDSDSEEEEEARQLQAQEEARAQEERDITKLTRKLEDIWLDLNDSETNKTEQEQDKFFERHEEYIRPQSESINKKFEIDDRNLLYKIAQTGSKVKESPWLVQRLAREYPALLEERDSHSEGALIRAIRRNLKWFIEASLTSGIPKATLQGLLGPVTEEEEKAGTKQNAILIAMKMEGFDSSTLLELIEAASEHTLAAQDTSGLTPLHHAVEWDNCTRDRVPVINALIQYGDRAFDKFTRHGDRSVYRHHLFTRPRREIEKLKPSDIKKSKNSDIPDRSKREPAGPARAEGREKEKAKPKDPQSGPAGPGESAKHTVHDEPIKSKSHTGKDGGSLKAPEEKRKGETGQSVHKNDEMSPSQLVIRRSSTMNADGKPIPRATKQENAQPNSPNEGRPVVGHAQLNSLAPAAATDTSNLLQKSPRNNASRNITDVKGTISTKKVADEVAAKLKLHYLRSTFRQRTTGQDAYEHHDFAVTRTHESALKFLYGDEYEHRAICFDFSPNSPFSKEDTKIDFKVFKKSFRGVEFDSALLYAKFGRLELEQSNSPRALERRKQEGPGRRDMRDFFDWLWTKRVRNIIKVTVDDGAIPSGKATDPMPHCDKAIIESLAQFDIEILDWRKIDICPLVLQKACRDCKNLAELHLWWSGNNAVLRSWSEPDGLRKLQNLKKIHLHEAKTPLDSSTWVADKIKDFRERLNEHRKDLEPIFIEHHPYEERSVFGSRNPNSRAQNPTGGTTKRIDEHEWLRIMDTFADGVHQLQKLEWYLPPGHEKKCRDLEEKEHHMKCALLPKELRRDITVALIDDGVNFMHPAISENLMGGKSFGNGSDEDVFGAPEPYHGSSTGHGTLMAYMIRRICPEAKIFVCKLDVSRGEGGKPRFTAESAAAAVRYATKRRFDIISMSWTILKSDNHQYSNKKELDDLEKALVEAAEKCLLFCSSPDVGASNRSDSYYPFDCTVIQKMFKIGAAKADGTTYGWSGSQQEFVLPGKDVEVKKEHQRIVPSDTEMISTGSSVSTALAAGLAALIIHCVRLGAILKFHRDKQSRRSEDTSGVSIRTLKAIKKYDTMRYAFVTISTNKINRTGYSDNDKRLGVESFFPKPAEDLKRTSSLTEEDRWGKIAAIARELVPQSLEAS